MKFKRQSLNGPSINMTPMLDGVFLLLLFFAVSASFRHGGQLNLTLPNAEGVAIEQQQHPLEVAITSDGRYSVNEQLLSRSDEATLRVVLEQQAARLPASTASTPLIIRADAQASHQSVVTVMDLAGQLGFVNVSIATVKTKEAVP